ncbi:MULTISPECIES: restriction endonuclease subunit S [Lactobacillus]|uniref:restriction endonuclease subunit S n=1 Tax=Lactobacillus TaxID=1578 RepID=UPI0018DCCFDC|nr:MULTISPECIES: restriction endonuclease subunit S [Lactobacillus]MBI0022265.1 restriction endonuclease subunit S [Lactobacillus sp. W8172]WLS85308.1 restriction endonuclease subunit S [Lactobacillus apis]
MNEHKAVPNIRFNGFKSNWEKIQLKNYVTWYKGSGLSKKYLNVKNIGAPVIHYSDLYKFSEVIKNVRHWSTINQGKLISNNSILFPSSDVTPNGLARTSALVKNGVKAGGDIIIGTLKTSLSNVFMSYQINRNYKDILRMVSGTTIRHIHATDLSNLSEYITYYPEQQKIGDFFTKLDKLLDLQQQKIDKLELLKKALLQTLFPRHDAQIPEFRFKGFEEDWKKTRIGKIVQYSNSTYSVKDLKQKKEKKFYSVYDATGRQYYSNSFDMDKKYIAIIKDGSNVGAVKLLPARTSVLSTMGYLGAHNSDIAFDYYVFKKLNFKKYKVGSGIPHIYFSDYKKQVELVPQLSEQQKIGNLLSKVDQLIELENKKLQNFQQIKKCLLQNMFVE